MKHPRHPFVPKKSMRLAERAFGENVWIEEGRVSGAGLDDGISFTVLRTRHVLLRVEAPFRPRAERALLAALRKEAKRREGRA